MGGKDTFREAWRHYYDDAYGLIYVIDSSEENRLDENCEVLKKLLQEEKIQNKPILLYKIFSFKNFINIFLFLV